MMRGLMQRLKEKREENSIGSMSDQDAYNLGIEARRNDGYRGDCVFEASKAFTLHMRNYSPQTRSDMHDFNRRYWIRGYLGKVFRL